MADTRRQGSHWERRDRQDRHWERRVRALAGLLGVLSLEGGGGAGAVVGRPSAVVAVVVDVGGHG